MGPCPVILLGRVVEGFESNCVRGKQALMQNANWDCIASKIRSDDDIFITSLFWMNLIN